METKKKINWKNILINVAAILYLLFLCRILYLIGITNINPTKAALISITLCFLLGWLFFWLVAEDKYIDLLEKHNHDLIIQNKKLQQDLAAVKMELKKKSIV